MKERQENWSCHLAFIVNTLTAEIICHDNSCGQLVPVWATSMIISVKDVIGSQ